MRSCSSRPPMRKYLGRSGLLLAAAVMCFSLAGCSAPLFKEVISWDGGTLYNEKHHTRTKPTQPMSLGLDPNGFGYAENIPQGHPKLADNVCIEVSTEKRYTGSVTWRKVDDYSFEITFADSKYTLTDGYGKFSADWSEARIYNCNPGIEYWAMYDVLSRERGT